MDFTYRLVDAREAARAGQPELALAQLVALEAELAHHPDADPRWAARCRCLRVRQLLGLQRAEEALALLADRGGPGFEAEARLGANIPLQAAEVASRLGRSAAVASLLQRALRLRCRDRDPCGVVGVVHAAFGLLGTEGRRVMEGLEGLILSSPPGNPMALTAALAAGQVAEARWYPAELRGDPASRQRQERLYRGAETGDISMVYQALQEGADPNWRNLRAPGLPTPLMAAAFAGHLPVVQRLLAAGARPMALNCQGQTAAQLADDQGHPAVVALLSGPCALADRPRSGRSPGPRPEAPGPSLRGGP